MYIYISICRGLELRGRYTAAVGYQRQLCCFHVPTYCKPCDAPLAVGFSEIPHIGRSGFECKES